MTSLFFIMLVLFILTVVLLNKRMQATATELAAINKEFRISDPIHPECLLVPQYT